MNRDREDVSEIRLQKVLAAAGLGSRRACEQLIDEGRVEVDGQVVLEQGMRVDPSRAVIKVDGMRIPTAPGHVVLALNKPRGVQSTMSDERGRPCVGDYLRGRKERLFHVGRLDADTEGLLLFTNDGELAQRLAHPSHGVTKTYLAQVRGSIERGLGKRLRDGVDLEDGLVRVDRFRVVTSAPGRSLVEVVLHEGRKHVVRRLLAEVGHPVEGLVRVKVGPIGLGDLRSGKVRTLSMQEVGELYAAVGL
ncbi:MAG: pseudouridine synthase [Frankiales bacterium]|nr:pseudouridine synthase [Frankiales bacterium]